MVGVILPLVLLAEGIFPYLVPFFFSILQPSLDFSGQPSALHAVPVIISGKVLMGVFAGFVTDWVAVHPNYPVLSDRFCIGWDISRSAKAFALKSLEYNHTQKPGANPSEVFAEKLETLPLAATSVKRMEEEAHGERSHQRAELPVLLCRYLTLLFPTA